MTNNADEFFNVLLQIAKFILDATLTSICTVLLILASLIPWRFPFILRALHKVFTSKQVTLKEFQLEAVEQFFYSVADAILFILVLPCFLWPVRWPAIAFAARNCFTSLREGNKAHEHWTMRSWWFTVFWDSWRCFPVFSFGG
eukprot:Skav230718  [mRNA]  locus=scaffold715:246622:251658:- [translate_table: standard]